jgi:hypothetical protein
MKFPLPVLPAVLLACLVSTAALCAAESATPAPAAASDKTLEPFARELKGGYPGHVAGCSVAKGHVTKAVVSKYCPMRTSLCGEGARCGHAGARVSAVLDIAVDGVVFSNVENGAPPPAEFKNWRSFKDTGLKEGDAVLFSFYTYKNNVPPMIATITKALPAAPAANPAPAGAALAYKLGEGYFVKNTHPIPAAGVDGLWLDTPEAFDAVFQKTPPLMGGRRTEQVDMTGTVALAVIYQGNSVPEMTVTSVTVKAGAVEVAYTLVRPAADGSAVFAVPLIVVVEKAALSKAGGAKSVRFIENGKPAGTAAAPAP